MSLYPSELLQCNKPKAEKRHLLPAVWPAEREHEHTSLFRVSVTVQPDWMQKQMVHLGVEATQRDADKPLQQPRSHILEDGL